MAVIMDGIQLLDGHLVTFEDWEDLNTYRDMTKRHDNERLYLAEEQNQGYFL